MVLDKHQRCYHLDLQLSHQRVKYRRVCHIWYQDSRHWRTLTSSPSLTCKLLRATLFIWIRPSSTLSELKHISMVSRLFFPLSNIMLVSKLLMRKLDTHRQITVSPRKRESSSIVAAYHARDTAAMVDGCCCCCWCGGWHDRRKVYAAERLTLSLSPRMTDAKSMSRWRVRRTRSELEKSTHDHVIIKGRLKWLEVCLFSSHLSPLLMQLPPLL